MKTSIEIQGAWGERSLDVRPLPCSPEKTEAGCKDRSIFSPLGKLLFAAGWILAFGILQVHAQEPTTRGNSKLRWLPHQGTQEKTEQDLQQVQYTTSAPRYAQDTSRYGNLHPANQEVPENIEPTPPQESPRRTPTPVKRSTTRQVSPPDLLEEPATDRQPTLISPPAVSTGTSQNIPEEPAMQGEANKPMQLTPPEKNKASNGSGWTPSDRPQIPKITGPNSKENPSVEKELGKKSGEYIVVCPSVKDLKPITELKIDVSVPDGEIPEDCPWGVDEKYSGRSWSPITFTWTASALSHKPLYFEDEHLERYGHTWGPWLQPIVSHARFFATVPILPYKMGLEPPNECIYALGHYRPGSCAPYYLDPIPLSVRAGLMQAGAVVGGVAIIP